MDELREDEGSLALPIVASLLDVVNSIALLRGFHQSFKKECVRLVRQIKLLQPLFEEMKEAPNKVSQPEVSVFRTLETSLRFAEKLLLSCIHGSKIYLVLGSESTMKEFATVNDALCNALKGIPWNLLDVSEDIREQIDFLEGQLNRAKGQADFGDWQLHKDLVLAFTCDEETLFDVTLLHRVADRLELKTALELDAEFRAVDDLIGKLGPKGDKAFEQMLGLLTKLRKLAAVGPNGKDTVLNEESPSWPDAENDPIIPDDFLCPISLELMKDPVIIATGQTYERINIERWLEQNRTCPKTLQVLKHTVLVPNFVLRSLISCWCEANGLELAAAADSVRGMLPCPPHALTGERGSIDELVELLRTGQLHLQRAAAAELRLLAKDSVENRLKIAEAGAIPYLATLLSTHDTEVQENAVTALLNLSIQENIKGAVVQAGAIPHIVNLLKCGSMEARGNAAATLYSLSAVNENKLTIGALGAIPPLVDLLKEGNAQVRKDAASALFNLLIYQGNKPRAVRAGVISPLLNILLDSGTDIMDEAVSVLALLATHQEGRKAIGRSCVEFVLVNILRTGSPRSKENAAAILLALSLDNPVHISTAARMGAKSLLIELRESGTERGKRKAAKLLEHLSMLQAE